METIVCLNCKTTTEGRKGKKFCSEYCKSNYNYEKNKQKENTFFKKVNTHLKLNRKLLKNYNRAGKSTVREDVLLAEGFNPNYFTHYWKTQKGDVYLFCYEFGFLKRKENDKNKFVLVTWQDYMNKK